MSTFCGLRHDSDDQGISFQCISAQTRQGNGELSHLFLPITPKARYAQRIDIGAPPDALQASGGIKGFSHGSLAVRPPICKVPPNSLGFMPSQSYLEILATMRKLHATQEYKNLMPLLYHATPGSSFYMRKCRYSKTKTTKH